MTRHPAVSHLLAPLFFWGAPPLPGFCSAICDLLSVSALPGRKPRFWTSERLMGGGAERKRIIAPDGRAARVAAAPERSP
jgi:hypothetical protein